MIDVHNHLMYGIDDGADSFEESAAMLDLAYKRGTEKIVLTPHFEHGYYTENEDIEPFYDAQREFIKKAEEINGKVQLYTGAEVMVDRKLLKYAEEKRLPTLNGSKYILVEFYEDVSFEFMFYAVSLLKLFGYIPVIAHADRYACLSERTVRVEHLKKSGTLIQINGLSIEGKDPMADRSLTEYLLINKKIDIVASDAHSVVGRTPDLSEAAAEISAVAGERYANRVLNEIPLGIITNTYLGEEE